MKAKYVIAIMMLMFTTIGLADVTDTDAYDWTKYDCDGVTTGFTYAFRALQASDLVVIHYDTATDTATTLTNVTDYTVSVTNNDFRNATGGTVNTTATYGATIDLIISTQFTMTQLAQMTYRWQPATVEDALDKSRLIDRQLYRNMLRCLRGPEEDDPNLDMEYGNAAARANKWLGFGATGAAVLSDSVTPANAIVSSWAETLIDDPDAVTARNTLGIGIPYYVETYASFSAAIADIGSTVGELHIYSAQAVTTDETVPATLNLVFHNGGSLSIATTKTVTTPIPSAGWYQIFSGAGNVAFIIGGQNEIKLDWFGAIPDDSTDCAAAFVKCFASIPSTVRTEIGATQTHKGGAVVLMRAGVYQHDGTLTLPDKMLVLSGVSGGGLAFKSTVLKFIHTDNTTDIDFGNSGYAWENMGKTLEGFAIINDASNDAAMIDLNEAASRCILRNLTLNGQDGASYGIFEDQSGAGSYIMTFRDINIRSIKGTVGDAIHLKTNGTIMDGMEINYCDGDGISIYGSQNHIVVNQISDCGGWGVHIKTFGAANFIVAFYEHVNYGTAKFDANTYGNTIFTTGGSDSSLTDLGRNNRRFEHLMNNGTAGESAIAPFLKNRVPNSSFLDSTVDTWGQSAGTVTLTQDTTTGVSTGTSLKAAVGATGDNAFRMNKALLSVTSADTAYVSFWAKASRVVDTSAGERILMNWRTLSSGQATSNVYGFVPTTEWKKFTFNTNFLATVANVGLRFSFENLVSTMDLYLTDVMWVQNPTLPDQSAYPYILTHNINEGVREVKNAVPAYKLNLMPLEEIPQNSNPGDIAVADNLNWDPASLAGEESYLVHCEALTLRQATYKWTVSTEAANEFFCELAGGGDPSLADPDTLFIDGVQKVEGTVGSLTDLQWDYGDSNTENGWDTIYIRIDSSATDPDTKYAGYVIRGIWKKVNE